MVALADFAASRVSTRGAAQGWTAGQGIDADDGSVPEGVLEHPGDAGHAILDGVFPSVVRPQREPCNGATPHSRELRRENGLRPASDRPGLEETGVTGPKRVHAAGRGRDPSPGASGQTRDATADSTVRAVWNPREADRLAKKGEALLVAPAVDGDASLEVWPVLEAGEKATNAECSSATPVCSVLFLA